jgi:hypothetical protein
MCWMRINMTFRVFIENEAGSNRKNHHDEKAMTFQRSEMVSRAYPYPLWFHYRHDQCRSRLS